METKTTEQSKYDSYNTPQREAVYKTLIELENLNKATTVMRHLLLPLLGRADGPITETEFENIKRANDDLRIISLDVQYKRETLYKRFSKEVSKEK